MEFCCQRIPVIDKGKVLPEKKKNLTRDQFEQIDQPLFRSIGAVGDRLGVSVYAVGGFVRDLLLGKTVKDIDFVVVGDGPGFAEAVAHELGSGRLTLYRNFGTAMIQHHDTMLEFVGARKESYGEASRRPSVESADLPTDLARRDFTVNAIAVDLCSENFGKIIDPFDGWKDLKHKILRTPLPPETTFFDDPLRIMRAVRFAAQLQFEIEKQTFQALSREAHRLAIISQERITEELFGILKSDRPSVGLAPMDESGVLDSVLPEIAQLRGFEQIGKYQHKDVLLHTFKVVDNVARVSDSLNLRFAALYHDVAKPVTKEFRPDVGWTFHGHEEIGARMMERIGKRLKLSKNMLNYTKKMIRLHLRPIHLAEEGVTDSAIRRLVVQAGDDLDDLILLCRADITSQNPRRVARHLANFDSLVERINEIAEKDRLRAFQAPVRGDEIMRVCGLAPGPQVGKLKKAIEEAILNGEIANEHDAAYTYLLEIKERFLQIPE
ncbi:HD domain-containing protein [candidate division KSB1 bacterium]|nr:HD domain-containing protein [candidate division KSB1 bacterium]